MRQPLPNTSAYFSFIFCAYNASILLLSFPKKFKILVCKKWIFPTFLLSYLDILLLIFLRYCLSVFSPKILLQFALLLHFCTLLFALLLFGKFCARYPFGRLSGLPYPYTPCDFYVLQSYYYSQLLFCVNSTSLALLKPLLTPSLAYCPKPPKFCRKPHLKTSNKKERERVVLCFHTLVSYSK